jgi:hypothetical protein
VSWQHNPYVISLLAAAVVAMAGSLFSFRRRPAPGAAVLAVLLLMVAQWTLGYALELASAGLAAKVFGPRLSIWALSPYR